MFVMPRVKNILAYKKHSLRLVLAVVTMTVFHHGYADEARKIMEEMDRVQRLSSDSAFSHIRLSSCKFAIQNKTLSCTEKPRVREMESVTIQLGANKKDSRSVSIVLAPASERGIGMLTYSYNDATRDTESWLYLSALGKVKRLASGSDENREPVAFFGSEFTTEDLESGKTDEYEYTILQEGMYRGHEVWVIEAIPNKARQRKTRYSKILFWLDKEKYVAHKVETFNKRGEKYKRILFKKLTKLHSIWYAKDITVMNLRSQRLSRLETKQIVIGVDIAPEFMTERTLTDKAFREKALTRLRQRF